jgi:hypothetical protein
MSTEGHWEPPHETNAVEAQTPPLAVGGAKTERWSVLGWLPSTAEHRWGEPVRR